MLAESIIVKGIVHVFSNWDDVAVGMFLLGAIGHAVQTFPPPQNKYGQWFLGLIQWGVGQRLRAANTMQGEGTLTKQVPLDTKNPPVKIDASSISTIPKEKP